MSKKDYNKMECISNGFYCKSGNYIREDGIMIGRLVDVGTLLTTVSIIVFLNMAASVTAVGAARLTRLGGTLFRASGVSRAILGSMALASGVLNVTSGARKYKNRNISRKLFDIISGKSSENLEKILKKISKKNIRDRLHIFNGVRDKNGNTLINAVLSSPSINVENKKKIINNMLENGAILYRKNSNDNRDSIEFVKNMPESKEKYELVNFIEEKLKSEEEKLNNELEKLKGKKFVFFRKSKISKLEKKINKNRINIETTVKKLGDSIENITISRQKLEEMQESTQNNNKNLENKYQKSELSRNSTKSKHNSYSNRNY